MALVASVDVFDALEEPRCIIEQIIPKFDPSTDISTLSKVSKHLYQLASTRQQKINLLKESIKNLSRKVELLKWESQRPAHLSEEVHNQRLDELERIKFMLAKNIQENESSLQMYENELESLRTNLALLEKKETAAHEITDLELQLTLFRAFGIELVASNECAATDCPFQTALIDAGIGNFFSKPVYAFNFLSHRH